MITLLRNSLNTTESNIVPSRSGRRILLVDDLAFLRTTVVRLLGRVGFDDIVQAKDGRHALEALQGGDVDCVLTDYLMPALTGLQLLHRIRTGDLGCRRNLPVVLLTGHAEKNVVKVAQMLDASAVLVKPCSANDLARRLEHALTMSIPLREADYYRQILVPDGGRAEADHDNRPHHAPWLLRDKTPPFRTAADVLAARNTEPGCSPTTVVDTNADERHAGERRGLSKLVALSGLQTGMVIAENLASVSGTPLLAEGTVLSNAIIERLRELGDKDEDLRHLRVYR